MTPEVLQARALVTELLGRMNQAICDKQTTKATRIWISIEGLYAFLRKHEVEEN